MLVLGRRLNEKLVFPSFGATVQVVAIHGSLVRLGVEAPAQVVVLREELCRAEAPGRSLFLIVDGFARVLVDLVTLLYWPIQGRPGSVRWRVTMDL